MKHPEPARSVRFSLDKRLRISGPCNVKPPAYGRFFPLSALLALNFEEQPGNDAIEQGPPPAQMPPVAVFPQEESHPAPAFVAAGTAFDCAGG